MKTSLQALCVAALAGGLLALAGCAKLEARNDLNNGVRAFKAAQFNEAIEDFQQAIRLDPTFLNARLYLATAYQSQFTPGATSPDNMHLGQEAVTVYQQVLQANPSNANAVAGIARMYFDMDDLDNARVYYSKQIELEPNNPTPYYSIAVIDWKEASQPDTEMRVKMATTDPTKPLLPAKANREQIEACQALAQTLNPKISEGLDQLQKALQLRPDYADAMTYINLLYRQKADMECADKAATQTDLASANDWAAKALDARKLEAARAAKAASKNGGTSSN